MLWLTSVKGKNLSKGEEVDKVVNNLKAHNNIKIDPAEFKKGR